MKKTIYYSDEFNDDFANTDIDQKKLPPDYPYFPKSPVRRVLAFILYYIIAVPLVFLMQKVEYHKKIVGRKKLKPYRKTGYFLYGNHTRTAGDAYSPALITFPKKAYIITSADSVSIRGIKRIVEDLGAIPIPNSLAGMKNFRNAIKEHSERNHVISVYPEAHIWPYFTDIRPFKDVSFRYPAETKKPVFCFTVTYRKQRLLNFPKTTVYIDGPFFPNADKTPKQNQAFLRNECYNTMKRRAENSTYQHVEYIKKNGKDK